MAEEKPNDQTNPGSSISSGGGGGDTTSPEGVLMLCVAGIIDVISLIPVINVVSGVLGIVIIGGWLVITRPGEAIKKAVKKFLVVLGIELIPIVSIAPSWTWFVYKILKAG